MTSQVVKDEVQNTKLKISLERTEQSNYNLAGLLYPKKDHQLVYILMLLWQYTRFQISIMQE